jgi:hypothetical protein
MTDASSKQIGETDENTPPSPPRKEKKQQKTAKQAHDSRAAKLERDLKLKAAHKETTILYNRELEKENGGMSLREVEDFVKKKIRE